MRYALLHNLGQSEGEGADGTVWFASDTQQGEKSVFVKLFKHKVDDTEKLRNRAMREWAMVKRVRDLKLSPNPNPNPNPNPKVKRVRDLKLSPPDAELYHPIVALLETSYGSVTQGCKEEGCIYYQAILPFIVIILMIVIYYQAIQSMF